MQTLMRGGILGVVLLATVPTDAAAAIGWLEKLSGPGPFIGWQVNVPFACYTFGEPTVTQGPADRVPADSTANSTGNSHFRIDYDCLKRLRGQRSVKFAIEVGRLSSKDNELPYPGVDDRQKPGVHVLLLLPSASYSFGEYHDHMGSFLDVGAGVGAMRLSDDRNFFETFWRPAFQPLRINFRPLALVSDEVRWEFIEIGASATIIGGELTASDFGAAGPFQESNELLWNTAIRIDLYKLFQPPTRTRSR